MTRIAALGLVVLSIPLVWSCTPGGSATDPQPDGAVLIDFNEYRGTLATLPELLFVDGEDGDGSPVGGEFYPFTGVSSIDRGDEFEGFGAFTANEEEFSFGIRERGSTDLRNARLFLEYRNSTDRTIYGFRVSYDVEAWLVGERDNRIRLKYHTQTEGFSAIDDIVSTSNPAHGETSREDYGSFLDGSAEENRATVELAFHFSQLGGMAADGLDQFAPLKPGDRGYLRWQYSNARLTDGSLRSALALNNIRVEPIFERPEEDGDSVTEQAAQVAQAEGSIAFGRPAGFYDRPIDLALHSSLADARIYFTTDGSEPNPAFVMSDGEWEELSRETRRRTFVYERPIDLEALVRREYDIALIPTTTEESALGWAPPASEGPKAATVRAVAVGEHSRSAVRTATYFLSDNEMQHHELPVWSLQTERDNFFSPDRGIYVPGNDINPVTGLPVVNYLRRGIEWERVVHAEFFERDRARVVAQHVGARIHGNYTRIFPQKSLRLYSRTDYGPGRMRHQFFDSRDLDDYNRLLLRNGGNDWIAGMLSDPTLQALVEHLPFDTQHYRPSVVYLNGEYWGLHNMRDRYDQHYLETVHGVPRDEVVIVEIEGVVHTGDEDEEGELYEPYIEFRDRVSSGEIAGWDALNEHMALSEYIDYLFAQIYAGNYDWPFNNIRYWKYTGPNRSDSEGPQDGRWRWLLYDVDFAFGHMLSTVFDMVEWTFGFSQEHPFLQEGRRENEQDRFELNHRIVEYDEVRLELLQRFAVHLATTAREERASRFVDRHVAMVESEIPRHIERWNSPGSMAEWREVTAGMRDFAERRPAIVRAHLIEFFEDATGTATLTIEGLDPESGLSLHTVDLRSDTPGVAIEDGSWSGVLLTGVPVTLQSHGVDLSDAEFSHANDVEILEQSPEILSFYLMEPTVLLALPRRPE